MISILAEQHVTTRTTVRARARTRRSRSSRVRPRRSALPGRAGRAIATGLLVTVAVGLVVVLAVLAQLVGGDPAGGGTAEVSTVPSGFLSAAIVATGLVQYEQYDDLEYLVVEGDTLSRIARRHGLTTAELAAYNRIANADAISVGRRLVIPGLRSRRLTTGG